MQVCSTSHAAGSHTLHLLFCYFILLSFLCIQSMRYPSATSTTGSGSIAFRDALNIVKAWAGRAILFTGDTDTDRLGESSGPVSRNNGLATAKRNQAASNHRGRNVQFASHVPGVTRIHLQGLVPVIRCCETNTECATDVWQPD